MRLSIVRNPDSIYTVFPVKVRFLCRGSVNRRLAESLVRINLHDEVACPRNLISMSFPFTYLYFKTCFRGRADDGSTQIFTPQVAEAFTVILVEAE